MVRRNERPCLPPECDDLEVELVEPTPPARRCSRFGCGHRAEIRHRTRRSSRASATDRPRSGAKCSPGPAKKNKARRKCAYSPRRRRPPNTAESRKLRINDCSSRSKDDSPTSPTQSSALTQREWRQGRPTAAGELASVHTNGTLAATAGQRRSSAPHVVGVQPRTRRFTRYSDAAGVRSYCPRARVARARGIR